MKLNKIAAAIGVFLSLAAAVPAVALAKHGSDDPAGHVRHGGDDGPRHR
jgi:hypothetical protein